MAESKQSPHNKLHGFVTRGLSIRRGRPQSSSAKLTLPADLQTSASAEEVSKLPTSPPTSLSKVPGGRSLSSSAPKSSSSNDRPSSPALRSPLTFGRSKLSNLLGENTSRSRSRSNARTDSLISAEGPATVRRTHSVSRTGKADIARVSNQRSHLGRLANASRSYDSLTSSALPSAQTSPTQPAAPLSPRKPTISSTHRAQPSRSFSPLPLSPFDPAGHRQWAPISPPAGSKELDPLKSVHAHMKAKEELMGPGPFYSVQRGWTKGVYTSRNEAERQIRNFPGPLMQAFDDVDEALKFLSAPANPAPASWASPFDDEEADGVRPGTPSHAKALAADPSEHKTQVQRIIDEAAKADKKAKADKRASLRSLPDLLNFAGADGLDHWAALQNIKPGLWGAQMATSASILLPVRSVANSIAFYTLVLGFKEVSNHENTHAVIEAGAPDAMRGPRIVLRALEAAPAGHGLGPSNSFKNLINGGRNRSGSIQRVLAASSNSSSATSTPPSDPSLSTLPERQTPNANPPATAMGNSFDHDSIARSAPPAPPPRHTAATLSGMCVYLEYGGQLDTLLNDFEEHLGGEKGDKIDGMHKWEGAKVAGTIETKPWGTRELSIIDPDGHRLIFSSSTEPNASNGDYEELTDPFESKERSSHTSAADRGRKRLSKLKGSPADPEQTPTEGALRLNGIAGFNVTEVVSPIPVSPEN